MENSTEINYNITWEGRYSQCSYNNLASVLDHFYGIPNEYPPERMFVEALPQQMRGYYGWAPYTGFMVTNQQLTWNSQQVVDLKCDWFDMKPKGEIFRERMNVILQFDDNEVEILENKLLKYLRKGPLILWVPYGAGMFRYSPIAAWKNVREISFNKYQAVVPWITHCIVIGGYKNGIFRIFDCSDKDGVFLVPTTNLIMNVTAMTINPAVEKLAFLEGFAFHCCIFKK